MNTKFVLAFFILTGLWKLQMAQSESQWLTIDNQLYERLTPYEQEKFNSFKERPYYEAIYLVKVNFIPDLLKEEFLNFKFPGMEKEITATQYSLEARKTKDLTWVGEIDGGRGMANINIEEGNLFGHFWTEDWEYELQYFPKSGVNILFRKNQEYFKKPGGCGNNTSLEENIDNPQISANRTSSNRSSNKEQKQPSNTKLLSRTGNCDVRVLVLYTADAEGEVANINNTISTAMGQVNTAFSRSAINGNQGRVVLAESALYTPPTTYTITNSSRTPLSFTWGSAPDADLIFLSSDADTQRVDAGADLVMLLTNPDHYATGTRGQVDAIGPIASRAYGFVKIQYATATDKFVFPHELAHLFGARHGENDDTTPVSAHAHTFWHNLKRYRSIVIDGSRLGTRYLNFSNPNVDYLGNATGNAGETDNAAQIRSMACFVANFETNENQNLSGFISGPNSVCQGALAFFQNDTEGGGPGPYTFNWQTSSNGTNYGPTLSTSPTLAVIVPSFFSTFYVKMTVTSADNQTLVRVKSMPAITGSGCNPIIQWSSGSGKSTHSPKDNSLTQGPKLNPSISANAFPLYHGIEPDLIAYPNPFQHELTIDMFLPNAGMVDLRILNAMGQTVSTIVYEDHVQGIHRHKLNASKLPSGLYYLVFSINEKRIVKKIVLNH